MSHPITAADGKEIGAITGRARPDEVQRRAMDLEANGYVVDYASNGQPGLETAVAVSWDAILLDLSLPCMDGLTLCRKLREEAHCDTPVLMLTARDALNDKLAGFHA